MDRYKSRRLSALWSESLIYANIERIFFVESLSQVNVI